MKAKPGIIAGTITLTALAMAGCASTKTVTVPGPTITRTVQVPGPAVTVTVTEQPPPPAPGTTIGKWSGTGNENTPSFSAPDSGDYIVTWKYSGNSDSYGGVNFIISATDSSALADALPNDIASSGKGSTEITGANPGAAESFNVQAAGSWTITVTTAP